MIRSRSRIQQVRTGSSGSGRPRPAEEAALAAHPAVCDAVVDVRAIEEPSPAVNGGQLRCERDELGGHHGVRVQNLRPLAICFLAQDVDAGGGVHVGLGADEALPGQVLAGRLGDPEGGVKALVVAGMPSASAARGARAATSAAT